MTKDDDKTDEYGLTAAEEAEYEKMENMASEYATKSDFSKAVLAFECFKKVFFLRAVEMRKGYYNYTYLKDGNELKTWMPDSRKEFVSGVKALLSILAPELNNTPKFAIAVAVEQKKLEDIWNNFAYKEVIKDDEGIYKKSGIEFIPEPDTSVLVKVNGVYQDEIGAWDLKIEHYWNTLVDIYDDIFKQLNLLIHAGNYFKGKIIIG